MNLVAWNLVLLVKIAIISACLKKRCRFSYDNAFHPSTVPYGSCREQTKRVNIHKWEEWRYCHIPDEYCDDHRDQTRTMCSCRETQSCSWGSWSNWSGSISREACGKQIRYRQERINYRYVEREDNCNGVDKRNCAKSSSEERTLCSCVQTANCWWGSWSDWSDSISPETCGKQTRYRQGRTNYTFVEREHNCNGVSRRNCPKAFDGEERILCNCRNAKCTALQWSSWQPQVSAGQCINQARFYDYNATYKYYQQENHCGGFVKDCPEKVTSRRIYCSCEYKECHLGEWTAWKTDESWENDCPIERRKRHYQSITKYKHLHWNCDGVPTSCPFPEIEMRSKAVKCPSLPVPVNGKHIDPECNGENSGCQTSCSMTCNLGYKIEGNHYVTCRGDGKWDGEQGTCKDNIPPIIQCPNITDFNTLPNKNYTLVDLPNATATDNSGLAVTITTDHKSPLKVFCGIDVRVTYTATDSDGNTKSCKITIVVKDKEPPIITKNCPQDQIIQRGEFPYKYIWDEPTFYDNVDGDLFSQPNLQPGHKFNKGKYTITYEVKDQANNAVTCGFTLEFQMPNCSIRSDPPRHGSAVCNIKKDGIYEAFICTVSCKKGYWFLQGENFPKLYNFYVCLNERTWRGRNVFNPKIKPPVTLFELIPKNNPMWPDCAVGKSPDGVVLDVHIFGGGNCDNKNQTRKLKQDFLNAIESNLIINQMLCNSNRQNCIIENFQVFCGSRKRRSITGVGSGKVNIKFSYAFRDISLASKSVANSSKLSSMLLILNVEKPILLKKVQKIAQAVLKDNGNISVTVSKPEIACKPGYEYHIVNGSGDLTTRTKCLKCPRGTYYKRNTKKCTICQQGFYQDGEGQMSCKKCAAGKTSIGKFVHGFHECKAPCPAGSYSFNGLETCTVCPLGTYQPMNHSTSCLKCPDGNTTRSVGSTLLSHCIESGIHYKIQSEGCLDPGIKGCGFTTIHVNGTDYSPHKRGVNFVVLDAKSGNHTLSTSFDWHSEYDACKKTYEWIKQLDDDVILLVGYQDDASIYFDYGFCKTALLLIGGKQPLQKEYRGSFALIGYKGSRKNVGWIQQKKSSAGKGPTVISGVIKDLNVF